MATAEPVDADLPKALVKRIVKGKLAQVDVANGGDGTRDFQVNKDALLAFCESGKVFIHYLTATANDVCKEAKRQTISADDVITALEDLEFGELIPQLKEALEAYKVEAREKNKKKAEASKKRKAEREQEGGAAAGGAEDGLEGPEAAQGAAEQQLPVQQQEAEPRLKAAPEQPEQGPPAGEQQQEEEAQQQAQQLGGPQGEQQRAAEGVAQPEAMLVEGPPQ